MAFFIITPWVPQIVPNLRRCGDDIYHPELLFFDFPIIRYFEEHKSDVSESGSTSSTKEWWESFKEGKGRLSKGMIISFF
jgi:hypothetical protein